MSCRRELESNKLLDKLELEIKMQKRKKDILSSSFKMTSDLEDQLQDKTKEMEKIRRERDKFEKEVLNSKAELSTLKQTLDIERQERKDLETKALSLIKGAKKKWESEAKDKINQLNQHIDSQTVRITELCTSNNEMSSKLQRMECELQTANAELHKLRVFQVQHKESLSKMRELNRQSAQGVENKLEQIAARSHNQVAELRSKLELETAKNLELESKLQKEEDTNLCRQSRLNMALEMAQNNLKDLQEQLRSLKATIPARDAEIEMLKNQLQDKSKQLESATSMEQLIVTLQEQVERLKLENNQLRQEVDVAKVELNEALANLEHKNETRSINLERLANDKATLEGQLKSTLKKDDHQTRQISELQELVRSLKQSLTKLETENANLKTKSPSRVSFARRSGTTFEDSSKISELELEIEHLQQELKSCKEDAASERQAAKEAQLKLWKKEKELSDANLDKRIATREAKSAEEKVTKLQEEKKKLSERLNNKLKEEEEKLSKITKELETIKNSLADSTKEASRNKLQADSAQRALTAANKQIEELQSSSSSLRRELDSTRKLLRTNQDRVDNINSEKERLSYKISNLTEQNRNLEEKLEKLQEECASYQINIELLKETATVLEEQLNDYEKLTSNHETRENTLIQDKMKLQKDLENLEAKLREVTSSLNEEKALRIVAEHTIQRLESEASDIEEDRSVSAAQRDQYRKLTQQLNKQVSELTTKCKDLECNLSEVKRSLEVALGESRIVKEESTKHLTRMHELREANEALAADLQESIDQGQELRSRITELEDVLGEMRQFYQEREMKAGSTCQQQTKLIDYLQSKLEESGKKKKRVCDKIFGSKQKENIPPINSSAMPVGYRELENLLETERAKVKALTEQLLALKAAKVTSPLSSPKSLEKTPRSPLSENKDHSNVRRQLSMQRIRHNIPHRFNVSLPMRPGKCATCLESIQFGKRATICSECQIMTHLKCSVSVPATCGLPDGFESHLNKNCKPNLELSSLGGSVQTLTIDEPDIPERDTDCRRSTGDTIEMESWVKIPNRTNSGWERKYLKLKGHILSMYDQEPTEVTSAVNRLDLSEKHGFSISENVHQAMVSATATSDLPFIIRVELKSPSTCWPNSRLDIMALSQLDKKNWTRALSSLSNPFEKTDKCQTILKLEKNQLDLNTAVEIDDQILLLGAEEGLFSYHLQKGQYLTLIRGVKKVYQLTLHPQIGLGLMIAGEDRQLVSCNLRQLKSNAIAAECSRPAISTNPVLTGSESCHLYQIQGEMLCAATATHIILLKWNTSEDEGEFISVRELETQEPCSCALFTETRLIVGCNKFFQIDVNNYSIDDFPEEDNNSVKALIHGVAKLGIFPIHVLNVSVSNRKTELLLCYNEYGVFVNEFGQRTRSVDPTWSHLPFSFAFRKPYLYIIHFSSIEIIKLENHSYKTTQNNPERTLIELNNLRFLGVAGKRGIYVSTVNTILEILKIQGEVNTRAIRDSLTSLETLSNEEDSSSETEFSFTSSLLEVLDGHQKERKVHFS